MANDHHAVGHSNLEAAGVAAPPLTMIDLTRAVADNATVAPIMTNAQQALLSHPIPLQSGLLPAGSRTQKQSRAATLKLVSCVLAVLFAAIFAYPLGAEPRHAMAMHGAPHYPATMSAFPTVNPDAPKGGRIVLGQVGTFDTFRPFNIKGNGAAGLQSHIYQSLMARADDEPFSLYGLVAASVDVADDRRQVTFALRPEARFSDGQPLTSADVLFSQELLRHKGRPFMRGFYAKVATAEAPDAHTVRFTFASDADREMPLIMGLMPILPKHKTDPATYDETSLAPPIGSGPYRIEKFETGRSIVFRRVPDWWARDLAVTKGRFNFDEIRYDYFRDQNAVFEAFKAGEIDLRFEDDPTRWAEGYRFPATAEGRILKREIDITDPVGMSALVFNTRRAVFADARVRRALILAFDFASVNRSLYASQYTRTESFFGPSELSSFARPADDRERALLRPFPASVKPEVLDGTAVLPASDGQGQNRANLAAAFKLLGDAGYQLKGRALVDSATGRQLAFEFLSSSPTTERLMIGYSKTLERLGIAVDIRRVDDSQYWLRLQKFDYDMIQFRWASSLSPGNEQENRWSSNAADTQGSLNFAGVKSAAADAIIPALLAAREREDFVSAVRALDRVLRSTDSVIPLFYAPKRWLAHWNRVAAPKATTDLDAWWSVIAP